jgi:hypothetical protein
VAKLQGPTFSWGFAFLGVAIPRINFAFSLPPFQRIESVKMGLRVNIFVERESK